MKRSQNRARKTSVHLSAFRRQHATAHVSASMDTHSGYRGAYILLPQYIWACTLGALHIFGGVNLLILAGCHVRASAGDLAVHGALIPCACVRVCVCVRYQTPFSSRHESGPR